MAELMNQTGNESIFDGAARGSDVVVAVEESKIDLDNARVEPGLESTGNEVDADLFACVDPGVKHGAGTGRAVVGRFHGGQDGGAIGGAEGGIDDSVA